MSRRSTSTAFLGSLVARAGVRTGLLHDRDWWRRRQIGNFEDFDGVVTRIKKACSEPQSELEKARSPKFRLTPFITAADNAAVAFADVAAVAVAANVVAVVVSVAVIELILFLRRFIIKPQRQSFFDTKQTKILIKSDKISNLTERGVRRLKG